jgi:hypothetical protein
MCTKICHPELLPAGRYGDSGSACEKGTEKADSGSSPE